MSVTVVSVIYGHDYDRFEREWRDSLPAVPVILHRGEAVEPWPQARLLNEAIAQVKTEWVWVLNVDDLALPNALRGLDETYADVWLLGLRRSDREINPVALTNESYLDSFSNPYPSMSPFRKRAWETVGGYPIIANEDWGLWRRMARAGFVFKASGHVGCIYRDHPLQRTKHDVSPEAWETNRAELLRETS